MLPDGAAKTILRAGMRPVRVCSRKKCGRSLEITVLSCLYEKLTSGRGGGNGYQMARGRRCNPSAIPPAEPIWPFRESHETVPHLFGPGS